MEDRMTAQKLKNSILQMAVQGKLVPQDPNDEPASVLLERIRKEKEQLIKEGKIKRNKNESFIFRGADNLHYEQIGKEVRCIEDELPFEIPDSWKWDRWGNISFKIQYGYNAPAKNQGKIKMVRISDIQNNMVNWPSVPFCDISDNDIEDYLLHNNDILFARTGGTVGKSFLVNNIKENAIFAGYLIRTVYDFNNLNSNYLKYFMETGLYWNQLKEGTIATAQPNCNGQTLSSMFIPIPPIKEQCRIDDKIKKLEPLFDKYKQAEEQLNDLNSNIKEQLKKSILQYAIEGKLVPQDPNDEPASVLLERIHKEKEKLIAEGKIKKDKNESIIYRRDNSYYEKLGDIETCINDKLPYDLPTGWSWCNVGSLFTNSTGLSYKKDQLNKKSNSMVRVLRGGNILEGNYILNSDDVFISSEFVNDNLYLKKGYMITPSVTSLEHIGKIALIDKDYDNTVVGGFVLMLKPVFNRHILLEYLLLFFSTNYYREECRKITHKSGQAFYNLSRDKLMKLYIAIPPLNEQQQIVNKYFQISNLFEH